MAIQRDIDFRLRADPRQFNSALDQVEARLRALGQQAALVQRGASTRTTATRSDTARQQVQRQIEHQQRIIANEGDLAAARRETAAATALLRTKDSELAQTLRATTQAAQGATTEFRERTAAARQAERSQQRLIDSAREEIAVNRRIVTSNGNLTAARREGRIAALRAAGASRALIAEYRRESIAAEQARAGVRERNGRMHQLAHAYTALAAKMAIATGVLYGLARGLGAVFRASDTMVRVEGRLRLVASTTAEYAALQSEIIQLAKRARTEMESVGNLYVRLAQSNRELNLAQEQQLKITEVVSKSLAIAGASTTNARGAIVQFSQAMAGGIVRAEEFNALIEHAPPLLRAVSRHIDEAGGSIGGLRRLVVSGRLSSEEFAQAILKGSHEIEQAFGRMPLTFSQASQKVSDSWTRLLADLADRSKLRSLGTAIAESMSEGFDDAVAWMSKDPNGLRNILDRHMTDALALAQREGGLDALSRSGPASSFGAIPLQAEARAIRVGVERLRQTLGSLPPLKIDLAPLTAAQNKLSDLVQTASELRERIKGLQAEKVLDENGQGALDLFTSLLQRINAEELPTTAALVKALKNEVGDDFPGKIDPKFAAAVAEIRKEIEGLQEQIATYGLSARQLIEFRAAQIEALGVTAEQKTTTQELADAYRRAAGALQDKKDATEAAAAAERAHKQAVADNIRELEQQRRVQERGTRARIRTVRGYENETLLLNKQSKTIRAGLRAGKSYVEIQKEMTRATLEHAAAQKGQLNPAMQQTIDTLLEARSANQNAVDALDAQREATEALANAQQDAILTTGDLRDNFREMVTGMLRGTRDLTDLPKVFGDLAISAGANFFEQFLFGKQEQFDQPLIGNINTLFSGGSSGGGIIGSLFQSGGSTSASLFGNSFLGSIFSGGGGAGGGGGLLSSLPFIGSGGAGGGASIFSAGQLLGPAVGGAGIFSTGVGNLLSQGLHGLDAIGGNAIGRLLGAPITSISYIPGQGVQATQGFFGPLANLSAGWQLASAAGGIAGSIGGNKLLTSFGYQPGLGSTIGGAVGSLGGAALGTFLLPGIGTVIGALLGSFAGTALGGLFGGQVTRIDLEKVGIQKYLRAALEDTPLPDIDIPTKESRTARILGPARQGGLASTERALEAVGVGYALEVKKGGLGTVARLRNQTLAGQHRAGYTLDEAQEVAYRLAAGVGIDSAESFFDKLHQSFRTKGGFDRDKFTRSEVLENVRENADETRATRTHPIRLINVVAGGIDLISGFSESIDSLKLAARLTADEIEEALEAQGRDLDQYADIIDRVRDGSLHAAEALTEIGGLEFSDLRFEAEELEAVLKRVADTRTGVTELAQRAIGTGNRSRAEVEADFERELPGLFRGFIVARFFEGIEDELFEGIDLTEPLIAGSEAADLLTERVGNANDRLRETLRLAGLLEEELEEVGSYLDPAAFGQHDRRVAHLVRLEAIGVEGAGSALKADLDFTRAQAKSLDLRADSPAEHLQQGLSVLDRLADLTVQYYQHAVTLEQQRLAQQQQLALAFRATADATDARIQNLLGAPGGLAPTQQLASLERREHDLRSRLETATPEERPALLNALAQNLESQIRLDTFGDDPRQRELFQRNLDKLEDVRREADAQAQKVEAGLGAIEASIKALQDAAHAELKAIRLVSEDYYRASMGLLADNNDLLRQYLGGGKVGGTAPRTHPDGLTRAEVVEQATAWRISRPHDPDAPLPENAQVRAEIQRQEQQAARDVNRRPSRGSRPVPVDTPQAAIADIETRDELEGRSLADRYGYDLSEGQSIVFDADGTPRTVDGSRGFQWLRINNEDEFYYDGKRLSREERIRLQSFLPGDREGIDILPAARGYEGTVSEPTLFLAGEAGREQVSIRPLSGPQRPDVAAGLYRSLSRGPAPLSQQSTPFGGRDTLVTGQEAVLGQGLAQGDLRYVVDPLIDAIGRHLPQQMDRLGQDIQALRDALLEHQGAETVVEAVEQSLAPGGRLRYAVQEIDR